MQQTIEEKILQEIMHLLRPALSGMLLLTLLGLLTVGYLFIALVVWLVKGFPSRRRLLTSCGYAFGGALMVLGLLFSALLLDAWWYDRDKGRIDYTYTDFYQCVSKQRFHCAYRNMSPAYRHTHTVEQFRQDVAGLGDVRLALTPSRKLSVSRGTALLRPDRYAPITFAFVKIEGWWYLTGERDGSLARDD